MLSPPRRRPRVVAALSALVTLAVGLAACGGSSGDATESVEKAFDKPIKSARMALSIDLELKGVPQLKGPVSLKVNGPFESRGGDKLPILDWDVSASGAGQTFTAKAISTGDNAFVGFQGTNYEVGAEAVASFNKQLADQSKGEGENRSLKDFGIDPSGWLKDAKTEDDTKVAGVETTHVSAGVDVAKLIDDLNAVVQKANVPGAPKPEQLTDSQRKMITEAIDDPKIDVFIGKDDDVLRRLSTEIAFEIPQAERGEAGGAEGGKVAFSIEFADVGEKQSVAAPTGAKPIAELTDQLGSLFGGAGGVGLGGGGATTGGGATPPPASGGSTGGIPGGGTPETKQFEEYSRCLQDADPSDTRDIERCNKLLQPK